MTDEAKQLVSSLRNSYGYSSQRDNEAADMIEKLSTDLESDERQYGRDAFAILVDEGVKLEAERNEWKRRAEAAERELNGICWCCENAVPLEIAPSLVYPKNTIVYTCNEIEKHGVTAGTGKRKCGKWKWRGLCAENGGAENATD